jgi:hypothetical protein
MIGVGEKGEEGRLAETSRRRALRLGAAIVACKVISAKFTSAPTPVIVGGEKGVLRGRAALDPLRASGAASVVAALERSPWRADGEIGSLFP